MIDNEKDLLEQLRDRQPFRVPDGYFEGFTDSFMSCLPHRQANKTKVLPLFSYMKPWLYIAAAVAGVILLFSIYNKSSEMTKETPVVLSSVVTNLDEVDDEEFFDFIYDLYVSYGFNYDEYFIDN